MLRKFQKGLSGRGEGPLQVHLIPVLSRNWRLIKPLPLWWEFYCSTWVHVTKQLLVYFLASAMWQPFPWGLADHTVMNNYTHEAKYLELAAGCLVYRKIEYSLQKSILQLTPERFLKSLDKWVYWFSFAHRLITHSQEHSQISKLWFSVYPKMLYTCFSTMIYSLLYIQANYFIQYHCFLPSILINPQKMENFKTQTFYSENFAVISTKFSQT